MANRKKQKCLEYKFKLDKLNHITRKKYDLKLIDEHDIESLAENLNIECCTFRKIYLHLNFNCAQREFNSLYPQIKGIVNLCLIYYKHFPNECDIDIRSELSIN